MYYMCLDRVDGRILGLYFDGEAGKDRTVQRIALRIKRKRKASGENEPGSMDSIVARVKVAEYQIL